ncbi:hypothetical protein POX_g08874 [Penicillium oxalicum]|uniref:Uncharacterized protein n=1 Tax=Penicillium oxalicum (strain 114-2 / CGMCC 5302) TaxID=933388 RepID=S8ALV6_PENO1|nr:hypothetical protein POX_g08874 [Penicillium oxalicum]EPS26828.1 hypothetical protein PDE_01767 [Penicillium oxalicum 114-2]KAI2786488.1 hypothetical protein POX_g08874 [Penicillium oxalicum]
MHFSAPLVGAFAAAVVASPLVPPKILAYTSWDFALLDTAIPVCNPNVTDYSIVIYHRRARYNTACDSISADLNSTNVKSISWKSPIDDDAHDLCMFSTDDCSGGSGALLDSITDRWEVCYPYSGFRSFSVVTHGEPCV